MFLKDVERIISEKGDIGLEQLQYYYGLELELLRQEKSGPYSKVHGRNAGGTGSVVMNFIGILQGDDFFEANSTQAPAFEAGFLYTKQDGVVVGDVVRVIAEHDRGRSYKVVAIESIGLTKEVFRRYKLSAIGD